MTASGVIQASGKAAADDRTDCHDVAELTIELTTAHTLVRANLSELEEESTDSRDPDQSALGVLEMADDESVR